MEKPIFKLFYYGKFSMVHKGRQRKVHRTCLYPLTQLPPSLTFWRVLEAMLLKDFETESVQKSI